MLVTPAKSPACKHSLASASSSVLHSEQSMPKWLVSPPLLLFNSSMTEENMAVKEAAQLLASGRLVGFPTETVYGLGADASNPEALEALFKAKGRPTKHPVIVHVGEHEQVGDWCAELPDAAIILGKLFWPGPLTLVLKKAEHVHDLITGGQDTVAIRIPSHPMAQELLREFGKGVAAPSANKFGRLSPTSADDVKAEFGDELALVLDGGACQVGIESTIIDLSGSVPRILRPGMIQTESIYVALHEVGLSVPAGDKTDSPRVPGSMPAHYSPATPLKVLGSENFVKDVEQFEREGKEVAVLSFHNAPLLQKRWITSSRFPAHYAHTLYKNLRKLDAYGSDLIIVEEPPQESDWEGINDRLRRASGMGDSGAEACDGS